MIQKYPEKPDQEDTFLEYELSLIKLYGVVIGGKDLWHLLGYKTGDAFRQAFKRNSLPVPTFIPEGRKMRMARARDIAKWLAAIEMDKPTDA